MGPLPSLFLFVLVDILGFSLVLPLLPYLSKQYGLTPTQVGLLQSSSALAQLVAVPVIGSLSDRYGRKPLLVVCVSATFVSFLILANAETPFWLFFSRILDGLLGGNISLAQAYIADITTEEDRSRGMGMLGAAFGLGFILGPALGGTLVKYNYQYPAYSAAFLTFLNLVGLLYLPESLPVEKRKFKGDKTIFFIFGKLFSCLKERRIALILWMRFLYLVVFTMFESGFSYFSLLQLELSPRMSSYLLCFYGLMFAIVQAGCIKTLKKKFSEDTILDTALKVLVVAYLIYSINHMVWHALVTLTFLGVASGLMSTLITSRVSQEVEPSLMGGALGVSAALGSLARIIVPPVGGAMIENIGAGTPFILCSLICIYVISVEWQIKTSKKIICTPTKN